MSESLIKDQYFELAENYIRYTNQNIYLTGKAGTGKSTFLKYIKNTTYKNLAVLAPTGVAAIHAGGVTIHSFFNLPFTPFVPKHNVDRMMDTEVNSETRLFSYLKYRKDKISLLRELELLIIDEISMVRCDVLDAIDSILRHYRGRPYLPFGGVQVVLIGDVLQLPPIAKPDEWDILRRFYKSVFFFNAKVFEDNPITQIQFEHIYRQKDENFIDLLNHVRTNTVEPRHMDLLASLYRTDFKPDEGDRYITITTHRRKAELINEKELRALPGREYVFEGTVDGNFNESALPAERELRLKKGAQVMFLKNDPVFPRRYYNGKIATVAHVDEDEISVNLNENFPDDWYPVQKETWRNYAYTYNKETRSIDTEIVGEYTQYPLRAAWAITIHKSQGLTFEKVIIDAEEAFAPGQVYVALSRCTTLEGIVLNTPVKGNGLKYDDHVSRFSANRPSYPKLVEELAQQKKIGQQNGLKGFFHFHPVADSFRGLALEIQENLHTFPNAAEYLQWAQEMYQKTAVIYEVGLSFQEQLHKIFGIRDELQKRELLKARVEKAVSYFSEEITEKLLIPTLLHRHRLPEPHRMHLYKKSLTDLLDVMTDTLEKLSKVEFDDLNFDLPHLSLKQRMEEALQRADEEDKQAAEAAIAEESAAPKTKRTTKAKTAKADKSVPAKKEKPVKKVKQATEHESLTLYKEGKRISEIAGLRGIKPATVEKHLYSFVETGEIKLRDLLLKREIKEIELCIAEHPDESVTALAKRLDGSYSVYAVEAVKNLAEATR